MIGRLTAASSRRPRLVVLCWGVALVAAIAVIVAFLGDALSGDEELTSATDSRRADELRAERFPDDSGPEGTEVVVVSSPTASVADPEFERAVDPLAEELEAAGAVAVVAGHGRGHPYALDPDRLAATADDRELDREPGWPSIVPTCLSRFAFFGFAGAGSPSAAASEAASAILSRFVEMLPAPAHGQ